jgi:hypothetical protein
MTDFEDRRRVFEEKYVRDAEFQFKVMARRNKLLGLWAAQQLGKQVQEVDEYVKSVVISDMAEPGDEDVLRKILTDFEKAGVDIDATALRKQMNDLMSVAMEQLASE